MSKTTNHVKMFYLKNKKLLGLVIVIILALLSGAGIDFAVRPTENGEFTIETSFSLHLSDIQKPALIETEEGEEIVDENIVTVEEVSGNQLLQECDNLDECGLGAYIYAPTETPTAFKDYMLGRCENFDNFAGSQCVDLSAIFWMNYTNDGRIFSTCGTGMAKGAWNCKEYNAGNDFELIYNKEDIQLGDWIIFSSGQYGHVGMAMGSYNNGYVSLLGMNQGGTPCEGGGSATNIININLNSFLGAFRPKSYIKPEPEPTPIPVSNCVYWHVLAGDTMSKIMLECEGTVVYGKAMDDYAKTWYSLVINKGKSVYDGWTSGSGVGLFVDDDLEHRF